MLQGIAVAAEDPTARIAEILDACREAGVLLLRSASDVIRIAPPLIIGSRDLNRGLDILESAFRA